MKTFFGIPGSPPLVTVADDLGTRSLTGQFGWGKSVYGGNLAKAILVEHLGSANQATKYHRRFLWRTVIGWDEVKPWTLTSGEIEAALAEIRDGEKTTARMRSAIAGERPPVVNEGGIGPGGTALSAIRIKS